MLIASDLIKQAKEKLGNRNAELMADILNLKDFDTRNLKSCCPYHSERTPSFIYNPKNQTFHCFGCSKTVDIIDVQMEENGKTFIDAVKYLFEQAGINCAFGEQSIKTKKSYRYPTAEQSEEKSQVVEYLGKRKLSKNTIDYLDIRQDSQGNISFNYYDTNDVLTMVKYRPSHKVVKSSGVSKMWCQKNADTSPLLFNMNRINTSKPLLICEGELDCASAIEAGYTNTVSVPFGAGNFTWIEENWEWLNQFEQIIIWSDNDDTGKKMRKECIYRLGTWRTKYIEAPPYFEKDGRKIPMKDINECLFTAGKEFVMQLISNAQDVPIKGVIDYSDIEELDISQMDGVKTGIKPIDNELLKLYYGTLTVLSGRPGCVDSETEYFNGRQWRRISEYVIGDKELQYNSDGTAELVIPIQYHKYPCNEFYKLEDENGINQMVSDEHNIVYYDGFETKKRNVLDVIRSYKYNNNRPAPEFITSFRYGGGGLSMSDAQIRVMCMVIECATFFDSSKQCKVELSGDRLKHAIELLRAAKVIYVEDGKESDKDGKTLLFNAPIRTKIFDGFWHDCNQQQLLTITRECAYWNEYYNGEPVKYLLNQNGVRYAMSYRTNQNKSADFIQFAYTALGYKARKVEHKDNPKARYEIIIDDNSMVAFDVETAEKVTTGDGNKYCFTVPSGMLVLRRNGCINITGNSGKTSIVDQTIAQTIDADVPVFLFSKEMPERMSANWFNAILAGRRNMEKRTTKEGREYNIVPKNKQQKMQDYYRSKLFVYRDSEPNDADAVIQTAEECVRKYGCKLIVLDNLMMLDLKCSETDKNTAQTNLINTLIKFAAKFNVAVILIAHPRKTQDMNTDIEMYDISGTSNIINLAMRSIGLRRVSKKEKANSMALWKDYDVVLTVIKDRLLGKTDLQIGLWYDIVSRRFYTDYEEFDKQYNWDKNVYTQKLPYVNRHNQ